MRKSTSGVVREYDIAAEIENFAYKTSMCFNWVRLLFIKLDLSEYVRSTYVHASRSESKKSSSRKKGNEKQKNEEEEASN